MVFYLTSHPKVPVPLDDSTPKWKRHRYLSLIILCLVLLLFIWMITLVKDRNDSALSRCPQPRASLQEIPVKNILSTAPVIPSVVPIRVLNSTNEFGAAQGELTRLKRLGFISNESSIGNDAIYSPGSLQCPEQIRFGKNGFGSAATIRLAYPCAQFTEDYRDDNSVDVVLGTEYDSVPETKHSTESLHELANNHTVSERLDIAHTVSCPVRLR